MNKRFLIKFTKHLVQTMRKISEKEEMKKKAEEKAETKEKEEKVKSPIKKQKETKSLITRQYPKPIPKPLEIKPPEPETKPQETFNLGKLNPFIADVSVSAIECLGPNKEVKVKKQGKVITTNIALSQKEISSIIDAFAKATKTIPGHVYKAKVKDFFITAIISPVAGTRFVIIKSS